MWNGAWGIPPIDYKSVIPDPRVTAEFEEGRKIADVMIADPECTLKRIWARLLGMPMSGEIGYAVKEVVMALHCFDHQKKYSLHGRR